VGQTREQRYVAAALAAAFLVLVFVATAAYRATSTLVSNADWVEHSQHVATLLSDLLSTMLNVETAYRGYVAAGDERFLEPYREASGTVEAKIAALRELTADNASQQRNLDGLAPLLAQKMAWAQRIIEVRTQQGFDPAAALIGTGQGKELMDRIRVGINETEGQERTLLASRSAALRASHRSTVVTLGGLMVVALALLLSVYALVRRNAAEHERAEANLHELFDGAPDATVIVDQEGRITRVNAQVPILFGHDAAELLGQPIEVLVPQRFHHSHPQDRARYSVEPVARPMGGGRNLYARTKDGKEFPVEISLSPIRRERGLLVIAAVRDVTERVRAAAAVQEARVYAESIVDTVREPLLVLDAERRVHTASRAFYLTFAATPEETLGRRLENLGNGEWDIPRLREQLQDLLEHGTHVEGFEVTQDFEHLGPRTMLLNARGLQRGDLPTQQILLAIEDITERKRAEMLLIERQALERTNRELQEFAYVASHDLQEPLRKIQAFGDRVASKFAAALPAEAGDYLERMRKAAARMQTLINDLLSFSRVTTQAQPFKAVDLGRVLQGVLSDLEGRIEQTRGSVEVGALPTIEADPTQMRQLLQNLIGNALKFHRPDVPPSVRVSGHLLNGDGTSSDVAGGATCEIVVTDNGIGFDEKYLDRVFTIFQRLHGRNEYEGTGLGLAICRKIVERHRGRITARSSPGQGAQFVVTLPVRQGEGTGAADDSGTSGAEGQARL